MIFTDLGKITHKKNCKTVSLPLVDIPQGFSVLQKVALLSFSPQKLKV